MIISEEDLYGDLDEMFLSQSDGETIQTSEGVIQSSSLSVTNTTSQVFIFSVEIFRS